MQLNTSSGTLSFDLSDSHDDAGKNRRRPRNGISININDGGSGKSKVKKDKDPPSMSTPNIEGGGMVPYLCGRSRIFSPATAWFGNLQLQYKTEPEVQTKDLEEFEYIGVGGGSGGGGDVGNTDFTPASKTVENEVIKGYRLDVHLGLCLGPDVHMKAIYLDNTKKWEGDASGARTVIGFSEIDEENFWADFIFYDGRFNQTFNGTDIYGIDPPGYVGIAMLVLSGANATNVFPRVSVEVYRNPNPLNLLPEVNANEDFDVNPMTAAADYIINQWGGAGVVPQAVDEVSFTAAATRLAEEGIFVTIFNQEPSSAVEILNDIEDVAQCYFYQDPEDDKIKVRLVRYDLYDFNTALAVDESNSSVIRDFSKRSWIHASTRSVARYTSREKNYDDDIIMAQSPMVSGSLRQDNTATYNYPIVMKAEIAAICVSRDMIVLNQPAWRGELQINRQGAGLKPGDCFMLTRKEYNIENLPMIVNSRRDIAGDVGIQISFSELIDFRGDVLYTVPEPSLWEPIDIDPTTPDDAMVISAPYYIQIWAGYDDRIWNRKIKVCTPVYLVEPFNKAQWRFDVRLMNYPNFESENVGNKPIINQDVLYSSVAQLPAGLGEYDGWSNGIVPSLTINGVTRPQYIKPSGIDGVIEGSIFAFVNDEIMSFEGATDEGTGVWTLTNVHRGLLDTVPQAHPVGSKIWIINGNWTDRIGMSFDIEPDYIPELMFCAVTQRDRQEDGGYIYTDWTPDDRVNRPLRPVDTRINGNRGTGTPLALTLSENIEVSWKTRSRAKIKKVAIFSHSAHAPEVTNNGTWQTHKVWLTDFAGTDHDLGETTPSPPDANSLDVTIPGSAATGLGHIWVQAQGTFGVAMQAERYPVNIT